MPELKPFSKRAESILLALYGREHHWYKLKKHHENTEREHWEVLHLGEMATFDFNHLTRLVVLAHDNCVRATIEPCGRTYLKIVLWNRTCRDGEFYQRHPVMEQAIETVRSGK